MCMMGVWACGGAALFVSTWAAAEACLVIGYRGGALGMLCGH